MEMFESHACQDSHGMSHMACTRLVFVAKVFGRQENISTNSNDELDQNDRLKTRFP